MDARNGQTGGAVGFFDSGLGGLSVWREVTGRLPLERTVYLADNAHCPYGPQPAERIIAYSRANTERLLDVGCKLIVVACNTATAAAIDTLRADYPVPFIGMEPAVKPVALASKCHTIGVLATPGTVQGRLYRTTSGRFADNTRILVRRVEGWVEAVERGETAPTEL
ncbi:MAG: aspartate/glutamate racemase family protein, partial [Kiritimatiellae bacterium]|nr:aspartate/glutamate racemase family protein [Kiritimatiellia bacterium]